MAVLTLGLLESPSCPKEINQIGIFLLFAKSDLQLLLYDMINMTSAMTKKTYVSTCDFVNNHFFLPVIMHENVAIHLRKLKYSPSITKNMTLKKGTRSARKLDKCGHFGLAHRLFV